MSRTPQPPGARGSLRWIQRAVNDAPHLLDGPLSQHLGGARVGWRSPLHADENAEYGDADFLRRLGLETHAGALAEFWPGRGPQWDALGLSDRGHVLLVEAKAHVAEMCSPPTQASGPSRERIVRALDWTADRLGAKPRAPWPEVFYQYANRLAHLAFLRARNVPAVLVLVSFVGDVEMGGPAGAEAWTAAYAVAHHVMGLRTDHPLARHVVHLHPDVAGLVDLDGDGLHPPTPASLPG